MTDPRDAAAPGCRTEGEARNRAGSKVKASIAPGADVPPATTRLPELTPEQAAAHVNGVYVVVVHLFGERHRRRVYLNLRSAEAAVRRAEDRQQHARILLARLEPVGSIDAAGAPVAEGVVR